MNEEWRPVPGYEDSYEVSNLGRIRSLDRHYIDATGRHNHHRSRLLRPSVGTHGYLSLYLCGGGRKVRRTVHSIVAAAFLGDRPNGSDVMHIDGNKLNNSSENLRYGTRAENLHQTYDYGGRQAIGKLSKAQVLDAIKRMDAGESHKALAKEYGVSDGHMWKIRDGKAFRWLREELGYA